MKPARRRDENVAPGDDVVPTPAPVDEEPPYDRFCDLVLTGGVASGVAYPWAIVELARHFRFRQIGGTSVGAMAAALAAAAEYGRRNGYPHAFETLRLTPALLAETMPGGGTRMFSMFRTNLDGGRLIELWGCTQNGRGPRRQALSELLRIYRRPTLLGAAAGALLGGLPLAAIARPGSLAAAVPVLGCAALLGGIGAAAALAAALWHDVRFGIVANGFGLCKGAGVPDAQSGGDERGLTDWLHEGIQASAGLRRDDPPLTFRDLWSAPRHPGAPREPCGESDLPARRSIDLQMITTNVTHGRPYRLPLLDQTSRLYFRRRDLAGYLPKDVLDALVHAARGYAPRSPSDPPPAADTADLLELPGPDLPVVAAARLSLSYPLLFSAVPLWAIDYEAPRESPRRRPRPCHFVDGGASSNFPIHLFDAALPSRPTFGLWMGSRTPYDSRRAAAGVWLPETHDRGMGDSWYRFLRSAERPGRPEPATQDGASAARELKGFLLAIAGSATDWRDRTSMRLPHVRNRVARLYLRRVEGGLHIGMPREQILRMAHGYGTRAAQAFVERYAVTPGAVAPAWSEQRWVRLQLLVHGLRERLEGFTASAACAAHTVPITEAIDRALPEGEGPIAGRDGVRVGRILPEEARWLHDVVQELQRLEALLQQAPKPSFVAVPEPELRLRAPL